MFANEINQEWYGFFYGVQCFLVEVEAASKWVWDFRVFSRTHKFAEQAYLTLPCIEDCLNNITVTVSHPKDKKGFVDQGLCQWLATVAREVDAFII